MPPLMKTGFSLFPNKDTGITFASWMPFAIPAMIVCLLIGWLWLQLFFLGFRDLCRKNKPSAKDDSVASALKRQYNELGSMR